MNATTNGTQLTSATRRRATPTQQRPPQVWLIPVACVAGGVALAIVTIGIDRAFDYKMLPQRLTGSPTAAQQVLTTVAGATVTLASLVLSITAVVIQLAMGQFSPRIVQALLNDRRRQVAQGLFGATFVYSILVLREVNDQAKSGGVPGLSLAVAVVLALASLVTLFLYINHASQGLRAGGLIDLVGDNSRIQIDRMYKARDEPLPDGSAPLIVAASKSGTVAYVDEAGLIGAARRGGCVLELIPVMGDFVPAGSPLLRVHGGSSMLDAEELAGYVHVAGERNHQDDPAYGFRKLVDIAERSIAEPFEDPTTTVQAIDRLHDGLRQLAERSFPSGQHVDQGGQLRLVVRTITWDGYVRLAFDEIRLAGLGTPQVTRRLMAAIDDLKTVAAPERQAALDRQARLLDSGVRRRYDDAEDITAALTPDMQGIGSGPDVATGGSVRPDAALQGSAAWSSPSAASSTRPRPPY